LIEHLDALPVIPGDLASLVFPSGEGPMARLAHEYDVSRFSEITPALLQRVYADTSGSDPHHVFFWQLWRQLTFFGFRSRGRQCVSEGPESLLAWVAAERGNEPIAWPDPFSKRAGRSLGLKTKGDAIGAPTSSFGMLSSETGRLEDALSAQGFAFLSVEEFRLRCSGGEVARGEGGLFHLCGRVLHLSEAIRTRPISAVDLPSCPSVAEKLIRKGYTHWGDLPQNMDALLFQLPSVGGRTLEKVRGHLEALEELPGDGEASQLPSSITAEELDGPVSASYHSAELLDPVVDLANILADSDGCGVVKPVNWAIFADWAAPSDRRHTLRATGARFGISGERVRQVVKKVAWQAIGTLRPRVELAKAYVRESGEFALLAGLSSKLPKSSLVEEVLAELLRVHGLNYEPKVGYVTTLSREDRDTAIARLREFLSERVPEDEMGLKELTEHIGQYAEERHLPGSAVGCLTAIAQTFLTDLGAGRWRMPMRKVTRAGAAAEVFRDYAREHPAGVHVYQDSANLTHLAEVSFPGYFESERNFLSSLMRSDEAVLWDWGVYIGREQVRVSAQDLAPVVAWIDHQFSQGLAQMSSRRPFIRFRDALSAVGISSEHALYSCLRLFYPDAFRYPKCPRVFPVDGKSCLTNGEMVDEWLESRGVQSSSELKGEFVRRRGWQEFQLSQAIANSPNALRVGPGQYDSFKSYPVIHSDLEPLADYLDRILAQHDPRVVSIRLLFDHRRATCAELGIPNEYVLFALLARSFPDRFDLRRFPHASPVWGEQEASNRDLVADFALRAGRSLLKEEFRREFVVRRGWTDRALDNALRSGALMPLGAGAASESVHPIVLGWDEDKTTELEVMVQARLRRIDARTVPFGHLKWDVLQGLPLPGLRNGACWTPELARYLLGQMDFALIIGSFVVAHFPNSADVTDEDELIAWFLKSQFGGAAKTQELEARLIQVGLRSTPGFLAAQGRSSGAPWRVLGDEVLLEAEHVSC